MSISSIKCGNASVEGRHTSVRAEQCGSCCATINRVLIRLFARGERAVTLPRLVKSASLASEPSGII
jgi:hypothetical protein